VGHLIARRYAVALLWLLPLVALSALAVWTAFRVLLQTSSDISRELVGLLLSCTALGLLWILAALHARSQHVAVVPRTPGMVGLPWICGTSLVTAAAAVAGQMANEVLVDVVPSLKERLWDLFVFMAASLRGEPADVSVWGAVQFTRGFGGWALACASLFLFLGRRLAVGSAALVRSSIGGAAIGVVGWMGANVLVGTFGSMVLVPLVLSVIVGTATLASWRRAGASGLVLPAAVASVGLARLLTGLWVPPVPAGLAMRCLLVALPAGFLHVGTLSVGLRRPGRLLPSTFPFASTTGNKPRRSPTSRTHRLNWLATALVLALFLAIAVRFWAGNRMDEAIGPLNVGARGDRVIVHTPDWLFELTPDGTLQRSIAFTEIGFSGTVTAMQVLPNGQLLLGHFEARRVYRCDLEALRCQSIGPTDGRTIEGTFKFYWDEATARLYITDTARHRLLVQEGERGPIREVSVAGMLRYPNDLAPGEDGLLYVADTNHHRVVRFALGGPTVVEHGRAIPAQHPSARAGHTWPVRLTRDPADRWWILNANGFLQNGDIVSYSPEGKPLLRARLPADAEPFALAATSNRVLVTDSERVALEAIDPETGRVSDFGEGSFQDWLRGLRGARHRLQAISTGALWAAVLLAGGVVLVGGLALRDRHLQGASRRPTPPSTSTRSGFVRDVEWLVPDPGVVTSTRLAAATVSLLVMLVIGGLVAIALQTSCVREALAAGELTLPAILLGFIAMLVPVLAALTLRTVRTKVGARGGLLYFSDRLGWTSSGPPEAVLYTNHAMSCGKATAILGAGSRRPVYAAAIFEREIRPLLARAQKVGAMNLFLYQIMQRQPLALTRLALLVVVCALALYISTLR
jgi:hypothetical protein